MVHLAPVPTRSAVWSPVVTGLRADALDCLQTGVAALADLWHGAGSHLDLGAPLRFPTLADAAGQPSVEASLEQRLAEAAQLLGLRAVARHDGLDGPAIRDLAGAGGGAPLYVVADAYTMGWLPFVERQHLRHGFLVAGVGAAVTVVDAYHDDTRWGPARPGVWRLPAARFDATVQAGTVVVLESGDRPRLDVRAVLAANARALADGRPAIDRYLGAVSGAAGVDRLVLDTWTLSRSRALHAAWVAATADLTPDALSDAEAHAQSWRDLATRVFVAAARGGPAAPLVDHLAGLLHGDVALAARLADATTVRPEPTASGPGPAAHDVPGVRLAVVEALAAVLRLPAGATTGGLLRDLPNFNSFRLVDVIERVEARLGVELGPDDFGPASLRDVDSLCAAFARAAGSPAGSLR
ncbi:acyl carrier protein [Dactylosporangium matsuzakiense]|uniref:Uncharacterized protein n=1 Tax=Dactylosporangium matsuzakiense TaxID=53360 RepID=A0A9W6KNL3_9ACTN|nr:acyl carrier protein [Dactylosporangium matsuzakiense]UWZ42820.1 acyl carrier protein [Dactylosporangium matsuzakiense]GLL04748.1 hypothetical protein GCM10017581_064950 [Dactylosporangium matsuzakiense]